MGQECGNTKIHGGWGRAQHAFGEYVIDTCFWKILSNMSRQNFMEHIQWPVPWPLLGALLAAVTNKH